MADTEAIWLVDTHTHLNDAQFAGEGEVAAAIARAQAAGVRQLINMGDTLASSQLAVDIAQQHAGVYAGVGIHPEEARPLTAADDAQLAAWAALPEVVCIGEIGLDYHWVKDEPQRALQREIFVHQLDLARQLHLLREEPRARLLGCALKSLKVFGNGKCASMRITARDYRDCCALPEHNTAIVNYALNVVGVEAAFLAEERESGEVKASLRSLPGLDVNQIARKYGGGGHKQASGLRYPGTIDAMCEALEQDLLQLVGEKE